ncbi:FAD-binding oxidoreductase [Nocardia sp. NBC_00881]|uniref:FAD-binding oxidoreductase n=1 Tax=Nocardia sp. NBC_00881 TaxID=2975995 RepID=UPI0038677A51|nr:FAD-binding oxidoreductase [Nocardia sp. NBC_00881]
MASAFDEWRALLGERATTDTQPYTANLTEFASRELVAVLRPVSRQEVRQVVTVAARYRIPLHPISTGRNWGLGSKLPVHDGCAVVDLSLMNRILEINEELHYAIVEPGVTQGQLAEALTHRSCMLNITGSGEQTSVVGNVLERGVGIFGQRTADLRGLEAVLADAEYVRTGHWANDDNDAPDWHHYPHGSGPDVTGLFVQSGFGIVTAAVVSLYPRQNVALALVRSTRGELASHVDILAELRRYQLLRDRIEINGEDDPRLARLDRTASPNTWLSWVALWGDDDIIALLQKKLSTHFDEVDYYTTADPDLPDAARTRFRKLSGEPGNEYVDAMAGRSVDMSSDFALDDNPEFPGFVCALPAVPFVGRHVNTAIAIARATDANTGIRSYLTFNSVSAHCLEGFFRVPFDRADDIEVDAAHQWVALAQERLVEAGFRPMRTGIDTMHYSSGHQRMALSLKKAVDPYGLISPGRYLPLDEQT